MHNFTYVFQQIFFNVRGTKTQKNYLKRKIDNNLSIG
jgi:hypothetical protein